MNAYSWCAAGCLLLGVLPGPAAGQATVEAFAPSGADIRVELLGADGAVPPEAGMELLPWDQL